MNDAAPGGRFLRNQWYVAATAAEVGAAPLARRVCDEPLVLFRRGDGTVAALEDRCPHRKAPLSRGEVVDGTLQCGYHGMRFAGDGTCALIPGESRIPAGFRVRAYPAVERHDLVFLWFGAPGTADPALIPDFGLNTAPGWAAVHGYTYAKGHYQLFLDNVLDLTHVVFVHKTTLAGGGVTDSPLVVTVDGDRVHAERVMRNVATAPIFAAAKGLTDRIDRWQIMDFRPPIYMVATLGAELPGTCETLAQPSHIIFNSFTPETARSTHYFWSVVRSWKTDDAKVSKMFSDLITFAFDEDARIIEAQQERIETDRSGVPLASFGIDRAGAAARRIIERKLDEEARATRG